MRNVWHALGTVLTKAAVWCFEHPDQAIAIVDRIKQAAKAKQA